MQRTSFLSLLVGFISITGLAQPAHARSDPGWRTCAEEGGSCSVEGRAVVRYGADDRWSTRSVTGQVACGNEAFGDPAPDMRKHCEVRDGSDGRRGERGERGDRSDREGRGGKGDRAQRGSGDSGWTFCAAEGEVCEFRGQTEVRFGTHRKFSTRTAYRSVRCDVSDFGDPAFGVTKYCEVRSSAAVAGDGGRSDRWANWSQSGSADGWKYCAAEDGMCWTQGRAKVRFGDGRRYNTRTVVDKIDCTVKNFGDPSYNKRKHCEVQSVADEGGADPAWQACAEEGSRCDFSGRNQVRYGTAGRYLYRDAYGGVRCDSDNFGGDPFENRVKRCEIRR